MAGMIVAAVVGAALVVYLLYVRRKDDTAPPPRTHPSKRAGKREEGEEEEEGYDDDDSDEEVARITSSPDASLEETGAPVRSSRGVPQMGQMRPSHFGALGDGRKAPGAGGKPSNPSKPPPSEEDDPLFQPLEA